MLGWICVAVGLITLYALRLLRAVLSMPFPVLTPRFAERPEPIAFGGIEGLDRMAPEFAKHSLAGPTWITYDADSPAIPESCGFAVYVSEDGHTVVWVNPTVDTQMVDRYPTFLTSRLADGRFAVTQLTDPYFKAVDDPRMPSQLIAADDIESSLSAHREFVASFDMETLPCGRPEDVLAFAGQELNGIRTRLIEQGMVQIEDGVARPSVGFALKLLWHINRRPLPEPRADAPPPVSTSQLAFLGETLAAVSERGPSQSKQWLLLGTSSLLFVVAGWPLFGLDTAVALLAVVFLHEAGHWWAMRRFGYGNPHITLLPLLGGVTIGHENEPNAFRRAWVALAGPLPGVLLGGLLLAVLVLTPDALPADWRQLIIYLAVMLLIVNYLNVLPIPPLDGSHVVQAIVPPGWLFLQVLLVAVGAVAGVVVAWWLEFWPLALFGVWQLWASKSMWRLNRLLVALAAERPPTTGTREAFRLWVLEQLEQRLGPPAEPIQRLGLANQLSASLRFQPMSSRERVGIGAVYSALLIFPGLFAVDYFLPIL
ncbi:MAG: site-2 protease family protein [Pseudomonadota bacterium]